MAHTSTRSGPLVIRLRGLDRTLILDPKRPPPWFSRRRWANALEEIEGDDREGRVSVIHHLVTARLLTVDDAAVEMRFRYESLDPEGKVPRLPLEQWKKSILYVRDRAPFTTQSLERRGKMW
jgi:hypothetical protein